MNINLKRKGNDNLYLTRPRLVGDTLSNLIIFHTIHLLVGEGVIKEGALPPLNGLPPRA
jgi:hypothetical protein